MSTKPVRSIETPNVVHHPHPPGTEPRTGATINPSPAPTNMNAHSDEVMAYPRIRPIYWGNAYGSATTGLNALGMSLDAFFHSIPTGDYFNFLQEYGVNTPQTLGSTWLPHDPSHTLALKMGDIDPILMAWLDGGLLPEVPGREEKNLLYCIFLSPEVSFTGNLAGDIAYHGWNFYHKGSGKHNLFFAVMLPAPLATLTVATCHEMVEAFTDRSGNGWWDSGTGNEIGDICQVGSLVLNGTLVSSYWRNSVGNCLQQSDLTPPPPKLVPTLTVTPDPPPIGRPVSINIQALDPNTGAVVHGTAKIQNPTRGGTYVTVANFNVPGSSGQITLNQIVVRVKPEPVVLFPRGIFQPTDTTKYLPETFDLAGE